METIGGCCASAVSPAQSVLSPTLFFPSTATLPLSSYLPNLSPMVPPRTSIFIPVFFGHLIAATNGNCSGQLTRVTIDNIDSPSVAVADPVSSFSCCLLEDALQGLEIEATTVWCFDCRTIGRIVQYGVSYAALDFPTHMDALIAVHQLLNYDPKGRWLFQFSDPGDRTFGGRMAGVSFPSVDLWKSFRSFATSPPSSTRMKIEPAVLLVISSPAHNDNTSTGSPLELVLSPTSYTPGFWFG